MVPGFSPHEDDGLEAPPRSPPSETSIRRSQVFPLTRDLSSRAAPALGRRGSSRCLRRSRAGNAPARRRSARPERRVALAHQAIDERTRVRDAADPRKDDRPGGRHPLEIRARLQEGVGERLVAREDRARRAPSARRAAERPAPPAARRRSSRCRRRRRGRGGCGRSARATRSPSRHARLDRPYDFVRLLVVDEHVAARRAPAASGRRSRPCTPRPPRRARRRARAIRRRSRRAQRVRATPVGLCGDVITNHLGPRRHRAAHPIGIEREAVVERAIEPDRARAEQPRRAEQRIVARTLDQDLVARLEQRRQTRKFAPDVPRAVVTRSGTDAVARADRLHQRRDIRCRSRPSSQRPRAPRAGRRASTPGCCCPRDRTRRRARLRPLHVGRVIPERRLSKPRSASLQLNPDAMPESAGGIPELSDASLRSGCLGLKNRELWLSRDVCGLSPRALVDACARTSSRPGRPARSGRRPWPPRPEPRRRR